MKFNSAFKGLNRRLGGAQSRVDASEKRKITHTVQVFGFVGTDHLRTKIIINYETLEQVSHSTYLGCSISYQFSNDVEFKLAKFL